MNEGLLEDDYRITTRITRGLPQDHKGITGGITRGLLRDYWGINEGLLVDYVKITKELVGNYGGDY